MNDMHFVEGYDPTQNSPDTWAAGGWCQRRRTPQGCVGSVLQRAALEGTFVSFGLVFLNGVPRPHYKMQTDYITPRPQGKPTGAPLPPREPGHQPGIS